MIVLGIHGGVTLGQHEPGAALVINGRCVALCEEERYLRIKSCYGYLPYYSIRACLEIANIKIEDVDLIVSPGSTYPGHEERLRHYLVHSFGSCPKIELMHHQLAHVSAAFYASGLQESLCLSLDASGDGLSGIIAKASREEGIKVIREIPTQNSLGLFYTMMTYYLGFSDGDEYKVMGLAPYGEPNIDLSAIISPVEGGWLFDHSFVRSDPPLRSPFEPLYDNKLGQLLQHPPRSPSKELTGYYKNVARSVQETLEKCLLNTVKSLSSEYPEYKNLCLSGGVAMNCSANQKLKADATFDVIYVPPVSSDRGLALGCAYYGATQLGDKPWPLLNAYLGSSYSQDHIRNELTSNGCYFEEVSDPCETGAKLLADGKILGWHQGRSEAGARALGNRSILANACTEDIRDLVNARIKYREQFRPFAPSALKERADVYFQTDGEDYPYMCFTVNARENKKNEIRAVVHVDGTSRLQTVRSSQNEIYYSLIHNYDKMSGYPVILNTSFNLKGQPIVETPRDALMTFYGSGLDALIIGNFVVSK